MGSLCHPHPPRPAQAGTPPPKGGYSGAPGDSVPPRGAAPGLAGDPPAGPCSPRRGRGGQVLWESRPWGPHAPHSACRSRLVRKPPGALTTPRRGGGRDLWGWWSPCPLPTPHPTACSGHPWDPAALAPSLSLVLAKYPLGLFSPRGGRGEVSGGPRAHPSTSRTPQVAVGTLGTPPPWPHRYYPWCLPSTLLGFSHPGAGGARSFGVPVPSATLPAHPSTSPTPQVAVGTPGTPGDLLEERLSTLKVFLLISILFL